MSQSSLLTWLQKPSAITKPPVPSHIAHTTAELNHLHSTVSGNDSPNESIEEGEPLKDNDASRSSISNDDQLQHRPKNVEFRPCTEQDLRPLKHLTRLLLPIGYPDSFFREIMADSITNDITLLAFWHDAASTSSDSPSKGRLVGAVRCRLLNTPPAPLAANTRKTGPMLYLSTLVLLSPYRQHGIATRLVDTVTRRAAKTHGVTAVGAHVWEANEDGLIWYRKRGFVEIGRIDDYYRQLSPSGAVIMQKSLGVRDWI